MGQERGVQEATEPGSLDEDIRMKAKVKPVPRATTPALVPPPFSFVTSNSEAVPSHEHVSSLQRSSAQEASSVFYGVTPIAVPHLGYDRALITLASLERAGFTVRVFMADSQIRSNEGNESADAYCELWRLYLRKCFQLKAHFVFESEIEDRPDYMQLFLQLARQQRLSQIRSVLPRDKRHQGTSAFFGDYVNAIKQAVDAVYFNPDLIVSDKSNAKVYRLLSSHTSFAFLFLPTAHNLKGAPIGEGGARRRIGIFENRGTLQKKLLQMYGPPAGLDDTCRANVLDETMRWSVFPFLERPLIVQSGTKAHCFDNYEQFQKAYQADVLHPIDIKNSAYNVLLRRLQTFQSAVPDRIWGVIDTCRAQGHMRK